MAHFAELDDNDIVLRVLVVNNETITDGNGDEQESLGVDFLKGLYGNDTNWKQCSYNTENGKYWNRVDDQTVADVLETNDEKAFRGQYPGAGYTYDSTNDVFVPTKPFPSWVLDDTKCNWKAPKDKPVSDTIDYQWDEETEDWVEPS
tara:strand:- start:1338 stop:1778 length:441 start_codon:yes stop_codon:yes gene_type:complete